MRFRREVIEKEHTFLTEKIQESIKKEDTPSGKFRVYITVRMKYLNELANIHSALKDEYLDHYGFIEKIRERNFKEEIETIQAILKEGVDKGMFSISDIDLTSFAIITALKGLEYPWSLKMPLPDLEVNINKLLKILLKGLIKR